MRLSICLALVAPLLLLVGCGAGRSQVAGDDSGPPVHPTPGDDGGEDGGTCQGGIDVQCIDPCGDFVSPECVGGYWQCPTYPIGVDCPLPPPIDAGLDACSNYPPIACVQPIGCNGVYTYAACEYGQWSCQTSGECEEDVWSPPPFDDAQPPPDDAQPPPPGYFSCGDTACDPAATYCQILTGGPVNDDGGSSTAYSCVGFQSACSGEATCACAGGLPPSCGCVAQNGDVIVTCAVP
jgi:hypothetical protein